MQKPIAIWLFICCALVFAMVIVGGVTRLTGSGLSIVEWQPLIGAIPPLSQEDWEILLEKYRQIPQYQEVNKGMTLDEFKGIFWWEYFHRLLGRLIGLVYFIPFVYFITRKQVDRALGIKLLVIFILGGLQGLMGWYMVMSGLVNNIYVSQYRLTAHLGLAFVIFAAMFWVATGLLSSRERHQQDRTELQGLRRFSFLITTLIFIMVLSGGFVAGIHAGLAHNTFPLMSGYVLPPDLFVLEPWYRNFFENMTTVQFNHRLIAWTLAFLVPIFWFRARKYTLSSSEQWACHLLLAMLAIQISLGIATLLLVVPLPLAAAHQGGAMLLFTAALWVNRKLS
ncbi:cytochrome c oxidase assembly protein subunit 15 [Nitrosomonas nitrosa]|jgi:cytochrome c oxidase assembly protein subunit 15|uniref:Heme A synthase n=1 Tax=Nitrosomonas nitrosa TaxID=52442 RepID=A0A1I4SAB0_9PROT|nr:COX15/CtaA family protein [Nitrosomonas nitrosa]MCO6434723.1 COX15/CtaA family protein [Nitrosomonas nitrosa]PTQ98385.1 cytochrome c oxidase assembly protein subunit 15 [Nitrosomonas nitrosa]CAE6491402.1 Heme A synthase [Nitrosomonas nitrosa]SFM61214.1 cytochrome c oxidase assembly protein subunit 15 [Nitrosomonas nitrosa]